jgi:hypothetical protein
MAIATVTIASCDTVLLYGYCNIDDCELRDCSSTSSTIIVRGKHSF